MEHILYFPIPNKNCTDGHQIQQGIVLVMEKLFYQLIAKLGTIKSGVANSLIGSSVNKYLECTILITKNQIFMRNQIEKTLYFARTLKYKVCFMNRTLCD